MEKKEMLKRELLENCNDSNYRNQSALDIYFKNEKYFNQNITKKKLSKESKEFLDYNLQKIEDIHDRVAIDYFRNSKFELLIDDYCQSKTKKQIDNNTKGNNIIERKRKNSIKEQKKENLKKTKSQKKKSKKKQKQYKQPQNNFKTHAKTHAITTGSSASKVMTKKSSTDEETKRLKGRINMGESVPNKSYKQIGRKKYNENEEKEKRKNYKMFIDQLEDIQHSGKAKQTSNKNLKEKLLHQKDSVTQINSYKKKPVTRANYKNSLDIVESNRRKVQQKNKELKEMNIGIKDFLVRRSVFKCMHEKHDLENVVAVLEVINHKGNVETVRVSAGYCSECKVFFILESSYERLKSHYGLPMCRNTDEKSYKKLLTSNGMRLAPQSLLMQYGYNVGQTEGLSQTRRQKILAVLIDKEIMRKSEIISYLDFFISQRQYQNKYYIAISKWEADREFVECYKIGEYHQFGVNAIYRR